MSTREELRTVIRTDPFKYVENFQLFNPADREGSLGDPKARAIALDLMVKGIPIAFQMREVFGMMAVSDNPEAIVRSLRAKDETDLTRPWSTFMKAKKALPFFDRERVHPSLHWLLDHPEEADRRIGYMFHLRGPIKRELVDQFPPSILSYNQENDTHYLQFFSTFGHSPISILTREAAERFPGIPMAVTTFNRHSVRPGQSPEMTSLDEAREFLAELGGKVQYLLTDPTCKRNDIKDHLEDDYLARGSFMIVDIENLSAARDGVVPVEIAEKILGVELSKESMKPANFKAPEYPVEIMELSHPVPIRAAINQYMKGSKVLYERLRKVDWEGNDKK